MVPLPPLNLSAPSSSASSAMVDGRMSFDASGWTVSTGGGRATGGTSGGMRTSGFSGQGQTLGTQVDPYEPFGTWGQGAAPTQAGGPVMWLLLLAAAGFIILK